MGFRALSAKLMLGLALMGGGCASSGSSTSLQAPSPRLIQSVQQAKPKLTPQQQAAYLEECEKWVTGFKESYLSTNPADNAKWEQAADRLIGTLEGSLPHVNGQPAEGAIRQLLADTYITRAKGGMQHSSTEFPDAASKGLAHQEWLQARNEAEQKAFNK